MHLFLTVLCSFQSLAYLDLSHNRLARLEDAAFATLPSLSVLNLADNIELEINGRAFIGLESSLIELSLENISLYFAPDLPLPNLRILKLSNNDLPSIPTELAANMTSLRVLDLSGNDLTNIPIITHSLPQLRSLFLAANPITTLTNTSLLGVAATLEHLDIAQFNLNVFEVIFFYFIATDFSIQIIYRLELYTNLLHCVLFDYQHIQTFQTLIFQKFSRTMKI